MSHRRLLGKTLSKPQPNTFIGGLGATYTTPTDLAAIFSGLTASNITNFSIDGSNNIACFIDIVYTIASGSLISLSSFTYFIDADGLVTQEAGQNTRSNSNLKQLHFPNLADIGDTGGLSAWNSQPFWRYARFENTTVIRNQVFTSASQLKYLIMPSLTNIAPESWARSNMASMSALEVLVIENVTNINWFYAGITTFLNIKSGCVIIANPALETASLSNKVVTINNVSLVLGDTITINGLVYTLVTTKTNNTEFVAGVNSSQTALNLATSINADTRTGTLGDVSAGASSGILGLYTNITGSAGDATTISTSNSAAFSFSGSTFDGGGGQHPALEYAESTRGCDIRYKDDFSAVDAPTSLSASNITGSSFDLNFTPPTPNANGNFKYEVWLNDGVTAWMPYVAYDVISASGATISGLSSRTYAVKVRTADGFYNLSDFTTPFNVTL